MEIRIIDPTAEDLALLAPFLERHREAITVEPPQWTVASAQAYYRRLPSRARQVLRLLAHPDRDGLLSAQDLRDELDTDNLRGSTTSFRRILVEGERAGRWPAGLPVPVESIKRGGAVRQFQLTHHRDHEDLLEVFQEAIHGGGSHAPGN